MKSLFKLLYYALPRYVNSGWVFPCRNYTLEITYRCNLNCRMCCFLQEMRHKQTEISRREELSISEWLALCRQFPRHSNVAFTGGEVFVKQDFLILLTAVSRRCRVTLGTNGYVVDESLARALTALNIFCVSISIDGNEATHTAIRRQDISFQKAINALQCLARHRTGGRPALNINSVILPENLPVLDQLPDIAAAAGADTLSLQIMDPSFERSALRLQETIDLAASPLAMVPELDPGLLEMRLRSIIDKCKQRRLGFTFSPAISLNDVIAYYRKDFPLSRYSCALPYLSTRISPFGDVYPCMNLKIGNVRDAGLWQLLNSRNYRQFRKLFGSRRIYPACAGCCKMEKIRKPN